jgi:hypothetical protein
MKFASQSCHSVTLDGSMCDVECLPGQAGVGYDSQVSKVPAWLEHGFLLGWRPWFPEKVDWRKDRQQKEKEDVFTSVLLLILRRSVRATGTKVVPCFTQTLHSQVPRCVRCARTTSSADQQNAQMARQRDVGRSKQGQAARHARISVESLSIAVPQ